MWWKAALFFSVVLTSSCAKKPDVPVKTADLVTFTVPEDEHMEWQRKEMPDGSTVLTIIIKAGQVQVVEGTITITVYPQENDRTKLAKEEAARLRAREGVCATNFAYFQGNELRTRFLFSTCDADGNSTQAGVVGVVPLPGSTKGSVVFTGRSVGEEKTFFIMLSIGAVIESLKPNQQ